MRTNRIFQLPVFGLGIGMFLLLDCGVFPIRNPEIEFTATIIEQPSSTSITTATVIPAALTFNPIEQIVNALLLASAQGWY